MKRYSSPPVAPRDIEATLRNHFDKVDASLKVHAIRHEHAGPRLELRESRVELTRWLEGMRK